MRTKTLRYLSILLAAAVAGATAAASMGQDKPAIRPTKPLILFDGRSLAPFYTYLKSSKDKDPKQVFEIVDGQLRISGEEWGAVTTRDRFRDYHLIVEWKWGGRTFEPRLNSARDSGILVHGTGADGAAYDCWLESIECQIIEGGCGDFILVGGKNRPWLASETRAGADKQLYWQPRGPKVRRDQGRYNWYGRDPGWKDVLGFRGTRDVEKAVGEWNRSEVICDGDRITNLVNGVLVNHGTESSHTEGKIQIQSEGAEILIRRIELRPVDRDSVQNLLAGAASSLNAPVSKPDPAAVRLNRVIEVMSQGRPALGIFASDISTRRAASLGSSLDFVILDMEHSPFDMTRLETYLLAMLDKWRILEKGNAQVDVVPIVRLPGYAREHLQFLTKQVLDLGAFGVVIPHVETREEALTAVRAARYAQKQGAADMLPEGQRGVGYGWAARYWGLPAGTYARKADVWPLDPDGEILVWCMVESAKGVENSRAIASTPGVSGIFIGPSDLSYSLGAASESDPAVEEAIAKILAACQESGVPCGTLTSGEGVTRRLKQGFRFLAVGSDGGLSGNVEKGIAAGRNFGR
jgi:2-keto-3-deoxy-L-rhamnonate aldolase RhmA